MAGAPRRTEEYFWSRITIAGHDDCWLWTGYTAPNGYGHCKLVALADKPTGVHRIAWAFAKNGGVLPPSNVHIHHECETKLCCNPRHLSTLTASDHMALHKGRGCHKHGLEDWRERDKACRICDRERGMRDRQDPEKVDRIRHQQKMNMRALRARKRSDRQVG